jgi:tripartite-type tricarboxylate transporter receptor subunit TctC
MRSLKELIARAKAKPGAITQAHAGVGSSNHLVSEYFQMRTGAKFLLVPYKGAAPALTDVIGGQVETFFDQASTTVAQVQGGKIRAIAVTAAQRMAALPDVPTFKEAGLDEFEILNVTGLVGPAGMDAALVTRIRDATFKALENPAVRQTFAKLGVLIEASTPQGFADFIRQDLDRWARVVKEAGIQVN